MFDNIIIFGGKPIDPVYLSDQIAMEKKVFSYSKPFFSHLLFWFVFVFYAISLTYFISPATFNFPVLVRNHILAVALFYFLYLVVLPNFNAKKNIILGVLLIPIAFTLFFAVGWLLKEGLNQHTISTFSISTYRTEILRRILVFNEYFIYALGYWFAIRFMHKQVEKRRVEEEKLLIEIKYLKAQINPHFLYNTLSYFYSKILPHDEEVADGIASLTDMMRYSLEFSTDKEGFVSIEKEVDQLNNLIKINQLRYSNRLAIQFSVNGSMEGFRIMPHLLITLVENAFKHGDMLDNEHPVTICLDIDARHIAFSVHNKKRSGVRELSTNIGLNNIRSRLKFVYGDHYKFNIKDEDHFFTVEILLLIP